MPSRVHQLWMPIRVEINPNGNANIQFSSSIFFNKKITMWFALKFVYMKRWHSLAPPWGLPRDAPPPLPESVRTAFVSTLVRWRHNQISLLDGLPIFITHGASLARFARGSSAIRFQFCLSSRSATSVLSSGVVFFPPTHPPVCYKRLLGEVAERFISLPCLLLFSSLLLFWEINFCLGQKQTVLLCCWRGELQVN